MANTPEESEFTGAKDRIDDLKQRASSSAATHDWERSRRREKSGWMSPVEISEKTDPIGPDVNSTGRRASQKGFLPISLNTYLELLDWTGRQIRSKKRGSIPERLAPILERIGIDTSGWCKLVKKFGKLFKRAAGTSQSIATEAARRGLPYMHAPGASLFAAANE